jgi:large subunit ribosomal protein L25
MSDINMKINAEVRSVQGTGASRRLRRAGKVPGVVYGAQEGANMIELDHKETLRQLKKEAFHASILDMLLDGKPQKVLLRDYQMHPWKMEVLHVDFQRISAREKITMRVRLALSWVGAL